MKSPSEEGRSPASPNAAAEFAYSSVGTNGAGAPRVTMRAGYDMP
jgi:hypothetical protein